jgi:hypothetical protein
LIISMFQLTHKTEPARTIPAAPKPKVMARAFTQSQTLPQVLEWSQFLSSGPEDCEPSVDQEDFGKGGVRVEVEPEDSGKGGVGVEVGSEYNLELRISGNVSRPGMRHSSLLTVQTVRW